MGNRLVWTLLFLTGCGGSSGNTPSTVQAGAAGNGGQGGSGGAGFKPGSLTDAGSGGAESAAGSGTSGNASAGTLGIAGAAALPSDAIILGPYPYSGGYGAGGTDWTFALSLPGEGWAYFGGVGALQLNQPTKVTNGLLRAPSGSALSTDWICPGPSATWMPTKTNGTSDCTPTVSRCAYDLTMPTASQLSCDGASTSGALAFSAVVPDGTAVSTVTASLPTLNGRTFYLASYTTLSLDTGPVFQSPTQMSFQESTGGPGAQLLRLVFHSAPVTPGPGLPVTQWTLSDISVLYYAAGHQGPIDLLCATGGNYQISSSVPIQHSVSLSGVSEPRVCPGTATAGPVVLKIKN